MVDQSLNFKLLNCVEKSCKNDYYFLHFVGSSVKGILIKIKIILYIHLLKSNNFLVSVNFIYD